MGKLFHFLSYNNAVPIVISVVILGAGTTYAANNPEVFVEKTQKVISIDNSYIANINLDDYSPTIQVTGVEEDEEYYYITYELSTIELADHVWQDVIKVRTLEVAKTTLSAYRDLGVYVTKQLNEIIDAELKRLRETQVYEKRHVTQKQVATEYSGLVGGFLSDEVTTVEGYVPLVTPPEPEEEPDTFALPPENPPEQPKKDEVVLEQPEEEVAGIATTTPPTEENEGTATTTSPVGDGGSEPDGGTDTGTSTPTTTNKKPVITILGDNPARVAQGGSYTDLGATVSDDHDAEIIADLLLDGEEVTSITLDTSVVTTYEITYVATDSEGASASKIRLVEVYDPTASTGGGSGGGSTGGTGTTQEETGTGSTTPETGSGTGEGTTGGETGTGTDTNTGTGETGTTEPEPAVEGAQTSTGGDTAATEPDTSEAPAEEPASEPAPDPEPAPEPDPAPEPSSDSSAAPGGGSE